MMRKSSKSYLWLFAILLACMSLSATSTEMMRGVTVAALSPVWNYLTQSKESIQTFLGDSSIGSAACDADLQKLQIENQQLLAEISRLEELVLQERHLSIRSFPQTDFQLQAMPAQIIFRSPSSWSSSVWLNVGYADNQGLSRDVIAKNSPVVVGSSLIGVVDYVGEHQCRVRLITDSGLTPSVRAIRGAAYKHMLADQLSMLSDRIELHHDLFTNPEEKQLLLRSFKTLQERLKEAGVQATWILAKGELHGSSKPLWRSYSSLLHGIGFNYDFADEKGPERDLRSGVLWIAWIKESLYLC